MCVPLSMRYGTVEMTAPILRTVRRCVELVFFWGGPVIISTDFRGRHSGLEVEIAPSLSLQNCNKEDPPCPCVHVERLCFEMDKKYTNTKLQLLLSPCVVIARDNLLVRQALPVHVHLT